LERFRKPDRIKIRMMSTRAKSSAAERRFTHLQSITKGITQVEISPNDLEGATVMDVVSRETGEVLLSRIRTEAEYDLRDH
jgi:hypothetical protein